MIESEASGNGIWILAVGVGDEDTVYDNEEEDDNEDENEDQDGDDVADSGPSSNANDDRWDGNETDAEEDRSPKLKVGGMFAALSVEDDQQY
jgi:hypothetical protein